MPPNGRSRIWRLPWPTRESDLRLRCCSFLSRMTRLSFAVPPPVAQPGTVEGASEVSPDDARDPQAFALEPPSDGGPERGTWSGEILSVLNSAGRGLTHPGIMNDLKKSVLGDRLAESTKRYYTTVQRLAKRGLIEQRGKLYYSMQVNDRLAQRGEPIPDAPPDFFEPDNKTSPALILKVARQHPNGLTGPELVDQLSLMPEATESILRHPQFVYNVLSTMIKRGLLIKEDRRYIAAPPRPASNVGLNGRTGSLADLWQGRRPGDACVH